MIAIVDYDMGNVASVSTAFKRLGYDVILTDKIEELKSASHIILPGVGSFQAAACEIENRGLKQPLQQLAKQKPLLGICLGMQLLFTVGYEGGLSQGLDLIPGKVEKIETNYILPHIGWNSLDIKQSDAVFHEFQEKHVYFVHTFAADTTDNYVVASTNYGTEIPAIVQNKNIMGIQFHPEKSGEIGTNILKTFLQSSEKYFAL